LSSKGSDERYDGLLATVAEGVDGIEPLLDTFFGFLQRRTDFFAGQRDSDLQEEIVLKYLRKHEKLALLRIDATRKKNAEIDAERKKKLREKVSTEEEVFRQKQQELRARPKIEAVDESEETPREEKPAPGAESDDDSPALPGNGGTTDRYVWTQTLSALEVLVRVPPGTRARDCAVEIGTKKLKLGLRGQPLIIDGEFHQKIKPDDSMWTIIDSNIQLNLEKFDGMRWWNCVIQGDPEIDTKKIVPENSKLGDLDPETRGTVEKMMVDQRQKQMGLPTSDQQKQADLLEKFKKAHPEMDFSQARINYGASSGSGFGDMN